MFRAAVLRMAAHSVIARSRGGTVGCVRRNLGRIAACVDGGIRRRDGLLRWPARATGVRRGAAAVEHAADACGAARARNGLLTVRILRSPGLPGLRELVWSVLPVSAILELSGVTAFAMNLFGTFILEPSHIKKQPVVVPAREALS